MRHQQLPVSSWCYFDNNVTKTEIVIDSKPIWTAYTFNSDPFLHVFLKNDDVHVNQQKKRKKHHIFQISPAAESS